MTEQEINKQVARSYFERCWNEGDLDYGRKIIAVDYNWHLPVPPGTPKGYEGWRQGVAAFREVLPDMHWDIRQIIAEDDMVMVRTVWTGTHTGPEFMGIPTSGRRVTAANFDLYRMKDGMFVEHWDVPDYLAWYRQLGGRDVQDVPEMWAGSTEC
ncbi:MAG: ester cyclase [Halieaceae bacterium]|nr:ester cyclase [Halieaceae bacterium]